MKKIPLIVCILFLTLLATFAQAEVFDFSKWTPYTANYSRIKILSPHEALFRILRISEKPKWDPESYGYAYLISGPILIGKKWNKIEIEGIWWREKGPENYQEMNLFIFAKKPLYPHRPKKGELPYTNFITISYDTWNKVIRFTDMGATKDTKSSHKIQRLIPLSPRRFKFVLFKRGEVWWEYWEQEEGVWEKIYEQEVSFLFHNINYPFDKLYLKIGGWTSWEEPIMSKLHFKNLSIKVFNQ